MSGVCSADHDTLRPRLSWCQLPVSPTSVAFSIMPHYTDLPQIPANLAVLRLPYPHIVHPGLVLSVTLPQKQCFRILRTAFAERRAMDKGLQDTSSSEISTKQPMIIACMPVIDPTTSVSHKLDSLDGWSAWGCAARALRLVHMPTTEECRLVVSGIARIYVEKVHAPNADVGTPDLVPIASVRTFFDPTNVPPASQDTSTSLIRMKNAAKNLISSLNTPPISSRLPTNSALATVPLLPPTLLGNILSLMADPSPRVTAPILSDLLVGLLGGTCDWHMRIEHLSLSDVAMRLDHTVAMLEQGIERVRILREVLTNTSSALQDKNYGALIRAQLEAIVQQVGGITSTGITLRVIDHGKDSRALVPHRSQGPRVIRRIMGKSDNEPDNDYDMGLPNDNTAGDEVKELTTRLAQSALPPEPKRVCEQELRRLQRMPPQSMERGVLINYLDTMLDLPWDRISDDLPPEERRTLVPSTFASLQGTESLMDRARSVLEADHYGLEKIKKRMLEYLAILQLKTQQAHDRRKASYKGPILLLVGPPGTGKTSIARSLAAALQRPFVRLSLGGVRDEAEIRGHRRTYVGALPGSIVSSLRKARASDCVMLLDELDKLSSGMGVHGDPTAAMLEVLDPEQNHTFKDHYLNVPVDLSRVIFIATANSLDTIPEPLLDRVDTVHVAGYTFDEKVAIAQRHLVPKQLDSHGLSNAQVMLSQDVLMHVAQSYTREAGVRTMERRIGDIIRAKAVEYAEAPNEYVPTVTLSDAERILGGPTYEPEVADEVGVPGVATGMAYQGSGLGSILHIECAFLPPERAALKLTGSLGDVIRESAELAFAWVKAHAFALGISAGRDAEFPRNDVHLHMPSGATPKDGPSAGIAFVCAMVSMYLRVPLDTRLAMTGEITLRGHVAAVGGIKEKVLGAHRAGIRKVVLPQRNARDFESDVPQSVKDDMEVVYVRTIQDALHAVFGTTLEAQISTLHGGIEGRRRLQELEWHSRL